jgi:cytochrome P450
MPSKEHLTKHQIKGSIPPGPVGGNLISNLIEFRNKGMIAYFTDAWRTYGDIVRFQMGPIENYLLAKPDYIHHILVKNHTNYTKGVSMKKVKLSLGDGLFASEGSLWRRQRQLMQPLFTPRSVNSFTGVMIEDIEALLQRWEKPFTSHTPVDVNQEMMRLAMGIIGRTMFNISIDQEAMQAASAFAYVLEYVSQQTVRFIDIPTFIPTPSNRKFLASMRVLDDFIYGIIAKRRQDPQASEQNDLLALLMRARDPESGEPMSDTQLRDEVITIFFAGHETTAQALTWAWFLLAQHPEEEAKLHAELDQALNGRNPSLEELETLPYTQMVIDESMRLYPPILLYARESLEPDTIDGYHIPAGAMITLSQYITHRHPDYWEQPEVFNPENFTPEHVAARPRYAYFPFGGGQRVCIGNNFALLEMALALSMIGQRFRLRLVPGQNIQPRMVGTLRPNGPVMMTLEQR